MREERSDEPPDSPPESHPGRDASDDLLALKLDDLKWGLLADGHEIGKPKPVFPRIVIEEKAE